MTEALAKAFIAVVNGISFFVSALCYTFAAVIIVMMIAAVIGCLWEFVKDLRS